MNRVDRGEGGGWAGAHHWAEGGADGDTQLGRGTLLGGGAGWGHTRVEGLGGDTSLGGGARAGQVDCWAKG